MTNTKQFNDISQTDDVLDSSRDKLDDIYDFDNDMYDMAFASQPEPTLFSEPKKALKPGALSINEYKERRKSGKESRTSSQRY